MSEYEHLDIGGGIKVNLDTKGLSNGSLDVTSLQYDTDGYIGQLNNWIINNNISIDEILEVLRGLDPTLIEILNQVKKPHLIDFNEVLLTINDSKKDIIKSLYNRLKPIYVDKIVHYTKINYIEVRTTKYIYTKDEKLKGKEKVERIDKGPIKPINDDFLELTIQYRWRRDKFGRNYFKAYNKIYDEMTFLSRFKTNSVIDAMLEKEIIDVNKWKLLKNNS